MTINPVYTYNDDEGTLITRSLSEKDQIPVNAKNRKLTKLGLCYNRINSLKYGQDFEHIPADGIINIHPKYCNMNPPGTTLENEPGIPELYPLYFDKYDYKTGKFSNMKDSTKREYFNDLRQFYKIFTGSDDNGQVGSTILRFNDIKLKDYQKVEGCQGPNAPYTKSVRGSLKEDLFKKYALNLQSMVRKSNDVQSQLLGIINELFTYDIDTKLDKKLVRVKPTLTEQKLQNIVVKTRKIIINYYLTCETDFTEGVKLYQAIVENQIRVTTEEQLKSLDNVSKELTYTANVPSSPEEMNMAEDIPSEENNEAVKKSNIENEEQEIALKEADEAVKESNIENEEQEIALKEADEAAQESKIENEEQEIALKEADEATQESKIENEEQEIALKEAETLNENK